MNEPKFYMVSDLIRDLQELVAQNPAMADWPMQSEGCDCYGDANGIEAMSYPHTVKSSRYDDDEWSLVADGSVILKRREM